MLTGKNKITYFDNAASSWPKPEVVYQAMDDFMRNIGGNPGRSGHRVSIAAARIIFEARESLAGLFGLADSSRIIFTANATEALNLAIKGALKKGGQVITSGFEHNSVMRPLRFLEQESKVQITSIGPSQDEMVDLRLLEKAITAQTKLIVSVHGSNVTGDIAPIEKISAIAKKHKIPFLVDASQTAGCMPIDLSRLEIDMLAFTGHKALLGPQGTGGLYIKEGIELAALKQGGTGSSSESERQPDFLPDKYESGTPNTVGIAGLGAGVKYILKTGIQEVWKKKKHLRAYLLKSLGSIDRIKIYGNLQPEGLAVVSFNLGDLSPSEIARQLSEKFAIMTRPGLHCSPLAHRTINTFPKGTLRASLSNFNTSQEIDHFIKCLKKIARNPA
ncbi:MAG: aminotransferase class V-fold PLP-dependent enzyme [Candidatus Omnitrophica bacterium]|nr:aminotransferase class V-fold PLP-dependent enzyme [Candidatus Omnitrophota bacterium]